VNRTVHLAAGACSTTAVLSGTVEGIAIELDLI